MVVEELREIEKAMGKAAKVIGSILEFLGREPIRTLKWEKDKEPKYCRPHNINPKLILPMPGGMEEEVPVGDIARDLGAIVRFIENFPKIYRELMEILDLLEELVKERKRALKELADELAPILVVEEL